MPLTGKNRGRLGAAAVSAAVALALAAAPAGAQTGSTAPPGADTPTAPGRATPLDGNGMWIWVLANSGGSAKAVAQQATRYGIDVVFVKSGDAGNYWSQFSPALVQVLHNAGIKVCAWQFVYGGDPTAEAKVGARAAENGADCLMIDAETSYEGRYAQAQTYMKKLRARVDANFPLALAAFPYVDYHPTFPYSVFLAPGNAQFNAPQVYWRAIGVTVASSFDHTYRYNRPYGAPIFPIGQTYQNPPRKEITDFRRLARGYGARGVSWWSWQETEGKEWRWVGRKLRATGAPAVKRGFAVLAKGSRGDLVIWAQQHLVAVGADVRVDGTYGPGTAAAVSDFQAKAGLKPTGVVNATTWKRLLKHRPVETDWAKRRAPRSAVRFGFSIFAPSEPFGSELPATPGVP